MRDLMSDVGQKRTSHSSATSSALCHKRTSPPSRGTDNLDSLIESGYDVIEH